MDNFHEVKLGEGQGAQNYNESADGWDSGPYYSSVKDMLQPWDITSPYSVQWERFVGGFNKMLTCKVDTAPLDHISGRVLLLVYR